MNEAMATAEGLRPLLRLCEKGERPGGVVSAVDVVVGRWVGVDGVNVAGTTTCGLPPLSRSRDKGKGLLPRTRPLGRRNCICRGRGCRAVVRDHSCG